MSNKEKNRYSDEELEEFKALIEKKIEEAEKGLQDLKNSLTHKNDNSADDTAPTFKMVEDGSDTLSREEIAQLAVRQEKFLQHLKNALVRIENKTYGICKVTGKLIPKERLRAVPHATMTIEAKEAQNK